MESTGRINSMGLQFWAESLRLPLQGWKNATPTLDTYVSDRRNTSNRRNAANRGNTSNIRITFELVVLSIIEDWD
jgi:hypothetical protein